MTALQNHLGESPESAYDAEQVLHLIGRLTSHISAIHGHAGSGRLDHETQQAIDYLKREAGQVRDEISRLLRPHQPVATNDPVPER